MNVLKRVKSATICFALLVDFRLKKQKIIESDHAEIDLKNLIQEFYKKIGDLENEQKISKSQSRHLQKQVNFLSTH